MGIFDSILLIVLSITFFLLYQSPIVSAKDTLFPGDELSYPSTLVSSNGIFTLGFYTISPSGTTLNLTYLGIWFTNEQREPLWIANRDQPIDGDAVLTLDASWGTLRVKNRNGATLFDVSDNKVGLGNNKNTTRRGKLLDSGNFIVFDVVTNGTIWESFDHPTDALVPGMKLGYNLTAKKNWELTSWANDEVPTSGAFTMRLENYQKSPQLLIYRHEDLYWASGPWNNTTGTFQFLNESRFELTYDPSGMYLFVQMIILDPSPLTMMQISPIGRFPADVTYPYGTFPYDTFPDFCYGGSEVYEGCVGTALHQCRAVASMIDPGYQWLPTRIYYKIGHNDKIDDNSSISLGDCMERCWNDCDCVSCSTYNVNGTGCIFWNDTTNDHDGQFWRSGFVIVKIVQHQKFVQKMLSWMISLFYLEGKRWQISIFLTLSIRLLMKLLYVLVLAFVMIRIRIIKGKENRRRDAIVDQLTGSNSINYEDELERGIQEFPGVKIFSLEAILSATNNFSNENKLGQGGYGPVYKGEFSDGRKIAIKRLSKTSGQGIQEFQSELRLISKLQHKNLVRLYGCCIHQEERMLIYEFMPNKSLDLFLFNDDNKAKIDWQIRFKIIKGIAQGLLYLHKYSRMRVIHRDLKLSNVLLDENMNPKISDFGMARIFQHDMSVLITKRVTGTYGYMAPEYVIHGAFSIKSDVFSFGVLILEIISGKRNSSFHSLLNCAWELWKREAILELKDKALDDSFDVNQLCRASHVGLLCVQEHANDRPTMSQVNSMLNNEIVDLPIPNQPVIFTDPDEVDISGVRETLLENLSSLSMTAHV